MERPLRALSKPQVSSDQSMPLRDYRCSCGRLLFKGLLLDGVLELKCKRCQRLKRFNFV